MATNYNNIDKKKNNDDDNKNTYNVYINSNKQSSRKKKNKPVSKMSDLDIFLNSTNKNSSTITEIIDEDELYEDEFIEDVEATMINRKKSVFFVINVTTMSIIAFLLLILMILNIFNISMYKRNIEANIRNISSDEIILESLQKKLRETSQEDLIEIFSEYGYIKISDYKKYNPSPKNIIGKYQITTNWFDIICNKLYNFLSKGKKDL